MHIYAKIQALQKLSSVITNTGENMSCLRMEYTDEAGVVR
jgi:hypothetical protein